MFTNVHNLQVCLVVLFFAIFLLKCDIGESNPVNTNENSRNKITGIVGKVQNFQGAAIADVKITAYPGEFTTATTITGDFSLSGLYSGVIYTLTFSKDDYLDTSIEIINLGFNETDTIPYEIIMTQRPPESVLPITDTIPSVVDTVYIPDTANIADGAVIELLDDFEDGNGISELNSNWYTSKDFSCRIIDCVEDVCHGYNESTIVDANFTVPGGANASSNCASVAYTIGLGYVSDYDKGAGVGIDINADLSNSQGISFYHKGDSLRIKIIIPLYSENSVIDYFVEKSDEWRLVTLSWGDFMDASLNFVPQPTLLKLVNKIIFSVIGNEGESGTFYIDNVKLINEPIMPSITGQPHFYGNDIVIDVSGKPVICQWQRNGVDLAINTVSGAPLACPLMMPGTYRCIVTNNAGSVVSDSVEITGEDIGNWFSRSE